LRNIYESFGNRPLWIGKGNADKMSAMIQALENPLFNYKQKPFDRQSIKKLLYYLDNDRLPAATRAEIYARLDVMLTNSFYRLARFIVEGDVDWALVRRKLAELKEKEDIDAVWEMHPKRFDDIEGVTNALRSGRIRAYLESLIPMEKRYRSLVRLLENYRRMDRFPKIPYSDNILKIGDYSPRIGAIKKRLQITGDYPASAELDNRFDETLRRAVLRYQKRHLLKRTGTIDKTVTWYLNRPLTEKIKQIIVNLDKTKLYPKQFENEYVEVNVPDFNLRYYIDDRMVFKTGVVVGRIDRPTPIFSDKIEYVVLNPTWTITDNLVRRDLIPTLRKEPDYLLKHNIHVFRGKKEVEITAEDLAPYENNDKPIPYRFVQFPGDENALGRIKFMFPNKYSVYLHDTDNKSLLTRRYKVYSSGCIRVDRPFELADFILRHAKKHYTPEEIEEILSTDEPVTVRLKTPVPIHILYFTVYVEDGVPYFKYDIYMYDKIIEESTAGHRKETFEIPKNRLITIKKKAPQALPQR
jgi:murein L,D-transpeptidase YcbB/YkuD